MKTALFLVLALLTTQAFSQNDTVNQVDHNGKKQAYWVYTGADRPNKGYCDTCIIECGYYRNDRRSGLWKRYNKDGTLRMTGEYNDNRPHGHYTKYHENNNVSERGFYSRTHGYIGIQTRYFEDGEIQSRTQYDSIGNPCDTSVYYFKKGCLEQIHVFNSPGKYISIQYSKDSCNLETKRTEQKIETKTSNGVMIESTKCDFGKKAEFNYREEE